MSTTALVLSTGGARGAFQFGAEQVLREEYGLTWDVVAGVSVGALNGVMIAGRRYDELADIWTTLREGDVFQRRSLSRMAAMYAIYKIGLGPPPMGFHDPEPLRQLIRRNVRGMQITMPFYAGRVELRTGRYIQELSDTNTEQFVDEILASAAIPVVIDPVRIDNSLYVDGGLRNAAPLGDVLHHNPNQVVIILTEPRKQMPREGEADNIIDVANLAVTTMLREIFEQDLARYLEINRLVKQNTGEPLRKPGGEPYKAYETIIVEPSARLGSAMNFQRERMNKYIELGREAAHEAMEARPEV